FPLWLRDTRALAADFVRQGYRAVLACVDSRVLPGAFAGREFDAALLGDLPAGIDPCGENGEFHTFVYAGPMLRAPVPHRRGAIVVREERFVYCDLEEIPTPGDESVCWDWRSPRPAATRSSRRARRAR